MSEHSFPLIGVWLASTMVLWMPVAAGHTTHYKHNTLLITLLGFASVAAPSAPLSLIALALLTFVHAYSARESSTTAALYLSLSGIATIACAVGVAFGIVSLAFGASCIAIALRVGLAPFHAGVASICEKNVSLQSQQAATSVLLVFAHLRFIDHSALAHNIASVLVGIGAVLTLLPALMALVQRDLRGFFRSATVMHGGMVFAGLGAAGRGHMAAALLIAITTAAAMTGLGMMVHALEERVGSVLLRATGGGGGGGGRVHNFPRLAAAFVIFAGAGVAMPGTVGFIADDLLLHALWEESVWGTATVILGSATLAVAALKCYATIFSGARREAIAPDLLPRERYTVVVLIMVLVWMGVMPGVLLSPADQLLQTAAPVFLFN